MRMLADLQNDMVKSLINTTVKRVNSSYASLVLRTAICFARCNWNPKNYRPYLGTEARARSLYTWRRFMVTSLTYMHRHVGECVAQAHRTHFEKQAGRRKERQIDDLSWMYSHQLSQWYRGDLFALSCLYRNISANTSCPTWLGWTAQHWVGQVEFSYEDANFAKVAGESQFWNCHQDVWSCLELIRIAWRGPSQDDARPLDTAATTCVPWKPQSK